MTKKELEMIAKYASLKGLEIPELSYDCLLQAYKEADKATRKVFTREMIDYFKRVGADNEEKA